MFKNNIWKSYKLPESVISDRGLQFVVELIKKLNEMLEIETKLSIAFHLQMNKQIYYNLKTLRLVNKRNLV